MILGGPCYKSTPLNITTLQYSKWRLQTTSGMLKNCALNQTESVNTQSCNKVCKSKAKATLF